MAPIIRFIWVCALHAILTMNVYAHITNLPKSGLFLEGSDIRLTCIVTNNEFVLWEEISEKTAIFIGKKKNTENKKYDNFEISSGEEDFTITIRNSSLSDEGVYVCKDGDQHANATVTIAVQPQLDISITRKKAHLGTEEVNITCSAHDGKPPVSWFEIIINDAQPVNVTDVLTTQDDHSKETFTSSATLPYKLESNKTPVICRVLSFGQTLDYTEVFDLPECNVSRFESKLHCQCTANPPVDTYYFNVSGDSYEGDILNTRDMVGKKEIVCFGKNIVGTGRSDVISIVRKSPEIGSTVAVIVITIVMVSLITVLVVGILLLRKCRSSVDGKKDIEMERNSEHEESSLLSRSDHEAMGRDKAPNSEETDNDDHLTKHTSRESKDKPTKDVIHGLDKFMQGLVKVFPRDWEIWATEEGGLSITDTKTIIEENESHEDQVKECLRKWISKSDHRELSIICKNMKKMQFWKKHNYESVITTLDEIIASEDNTRETSPCIVNDISETHIDGNDEQNEVAAIDDDLKRIRDKLKRLTKQKIKKGDFKDNNKLVKVLARGLKESSVQKDVIKTVIHEEDNIFLQKLSKKQKTRLSRIAWMVDSSDKKMSICDIPDDAFLKTVRNSTQLKFLQQGLNHLEVSDLHAELLILLKFMLESDYEEQNWMETIGHFSLQLASTLRFHIMLDRVGEEIGSVGAMELSKEFTIKGNNERFNTSDTPGSDIVTYLRGSGQINKTEHSMIRFANKLDRCDLLRATGVVELYIEKEFEELSVQLSVTLSCDWELFAIDDLQLEKDEILEIIEKQAKLEDQIMAALQLWNNKKQSKTKTPDLIEVISTSKVCCDAKCNHWQGLLRGNLSEEVSDSLDNEVNVNKGTFEIRNHENFLPNKEYVDLLQTIGGLIGQTGAAKLLQMYDVDAEFHSEIFEKGLLQHLSRELLLGNTKPYLEDMKTKLNECYLFRAGKLIDKSICDTNMSLKAVQKSTSESSMNEDNNVNYVNKSAANR